MPSNRVKYADMQTIKGVRRNYNREAQAILNNEYGLPIMTSAENWDSEYYGNLNTPNMLIVHEYQEVNIHLNKLRILYQTTNTKVDFITIFFANIKDISSQTPYYYHEYDPERKQKMTIKQGDIIRFRLKYDEKEGYSIVSGIACNMYEYMMNNRVNFGLPYRILLYDTKDMDTGKEIYGIECLTYNLKILNISKFLFLCYNYGRGMKQDEWENVFGEDTYDIIYKLWGPQMNGMLYTVLSDYPQCDLKTFTDAIYTKQVIHYTYGYGSEKGYTDWGLRYVHDYDTQLKTLKRLINAIMFGGGVYANNDSQDESVYQFLYEYCCEDFIEEDWQFRGQTYILTSNKRTMDILRHNSKDVIESVPMPYGLFSTTNFSFALPFNDNIQAYFKANDKYVNSIKEYSEDETVEIQHPISDTITRVLEMKFIPSSTPQLDFDGNSFTQRFTKLTNYIRSGQVPLFTLRWIWENGRFYLTRIYINNAS